MRTSLQERRYQLVKFTTLCEVQHTGQFGGFGHSYGSCAYFVRVVAQVDQDRKM
jgi:hypothetical protein